MGHHHHVEVNMNEKFDFTAKLKRFCFIFIIAGVALVGLDFLIGSFSHPTEQHNAEGKKELHSNLDAAKGLSEEYAQESHAAPEHAEAGHEGAAHHGPSQLTRLFANLLMSGWYLTWMGMAGMFFISIQYLANAGWASGLIRIPEAFSAVIPYAGVIMFVVIGGGLFTHSLYSHWNIEGIADPNSINYDKIIAGKKALLNTGMFLGFVAVVYTVWTIFRNRYIKISDEQEASTEPVSMKFFDRNVTNAATYTPIFAMTFCLGAFLFIMSLEPHWFSTMFSIYNFASMWVSGLAAITLTVIYLKEKGYMSYITENHLHDLGKFVFAFSIFWAYIWLGQFLLIWYANLPEEAVYFFNRWQPEYKFLFWLNLIVNFVLPFLLLMRRGWKRMAGQLKYVCMIVIAGHWLDLYMMVMPGTMDTQRQFGFMEIGVFAAFIGLFMYIMFSALSKRNLLSKNHPYLEESIQHEVV